jgi:hypothetical protein
VAPCLLAAGIALGALGWPGEAFAEAGALPDAGRTFVYEGPAEKYYLRAAVEELGLIGAGLGYYFIQQQQNSIDWALNYDWLSFRQKLTCEACAFDQNFFDTNFVTHPLAGTLYYIAARGNRLSVLESLGYAFTMSTLWEFLGEFRERVSVNDMVVTPLSGLAIGEATTELGAFFDRSCPTGANSVFGAIFGPSKSIHDALDDAELARSAACDERGLTTQGGHRFAFWAGAAEIWRKGAPARDELRFGLDMAVTHIDQLARPGRGWVGFSDGNVASIDGRVALDTEYVSDLRIGAHVLPAGVHYRDLRGSSGFGVQGHETTVGLLVGTEYSLHRQLRPAGRVDRIFLVDSPAARLVHVIRHRFFTLEASLDGGATFAGVTTFALPAYQQSNSSSELATVTVRQGYSHVLGLALAPRVRLRLKGAELGVEGRGDRFFALRVLDPVRSAHGTVPIYESRRRGEAWLSVGPPNGVARATFFLDSYYRSGTVGDVKADQREVSCGGRLEAVF